jgi:type II secretory pathway pseudopilin PulG
MKDITFSLIEIFVSLIIETVIMGGLFTWISNKTAQQNEQQLKNEMNTIENQNKLIYQELKREIKTSRDDVISQIKESAKKGG